MKKLLIILLITLIMFSCSRPIPDISTKESFKAEANKDSSACAEQLIKEDFDFLLSEKDTRLKLGVGLTYSPDAKHFYVTDIAGIQFFKIYLIENNNKEKEIFDYLSVYGEDSAFTRDMNELWLFWGGLSDCIYMYKPYSDIKELHRCDLAGGPWRQVDIAYLNEYMIITSIYGTNNLLILRDETYYSLNLESKVIKKLSLPGTARVYDQNSKYLLFSKLTDPYIPDPKVEFGLYDTANDEVKYLKIHQDASSSQIGVFFVPNTSSKISYMSVLPDEHNVIKSNLVIYDYLLDESKLIYIQDGSSALLGWNTTGNKFYVPNHIFTIR